MLEPKVRKSDKEWNIGEEEFHKRFHKLFEDPLFHDRQEDIQELSRIAFKAYEQGRKAPVTKKAGPEYANPGYDLSVDWIKTKLELEEAQKIHEDSQGAARVLVICASDRNDHTCPGEMSKSMRLARIAINSFESEGLIVEFLNLSQMTSEYGKNIYPCKGCVSTAMPLCHWPCSCYPNHSLGQVHDWMSEIYPMWVRAHGIMIITPVYWHQAPSALKLMIDRLVCADGGNPDPSTTHGKDPELAKRLERKGWNYPRHLEGRVFSLVVHGDTMGVDDVKNALTSWLTEINLIPASIYGVIGRYIGYFGSYADSHEELDKDYALMDEVRIAAEALTMSITAERSKKFESLWPHFHEPRPK